MHLPPLLRAARRFAVSRPEARRFAARAWLGAPVVRASLAVVGLGSTLRWIDVIATFTSTRRSPPRGRRDAGAAVGVVEGAALVAGAFRAHVVGGECLPRSLVQYLLHRLDGQSVRFVVGVRRPVSMGETPIPPAQPALAAHAWVDTGVDSGDSAAGDPAFAPLFSTGARAEA
jgi:hypothetical protein